MANGMRQILFVLVPAAAAILALSDPIIRLVYQRGEFNAAQTSIVATALFWFAFSLPTNGLYLLQTRTFFSLQRPWQATGLAAIDLVVSALAACRPLQAVRGRRHRRRDGNRHQHRGRRPGVRPAPRVRRPRVRASASRPTARITIASAALAGVSWVVWHALDVALGAGLAGQIISLGRRPCRGRHRLPRDREAAAHPRARADHPAAAAALARRCSARAATCWESSSWRCSSASPGSARPGCGRALLPGSRGAPAHPGHRASCRLALLIWVAELLGTVSLFKPAPYLAARWQCWACGPAAVRVSGGCARGGPRTDSLPARGPSPSTGPAGRDVVALDRPRDRRDRPDPLRRRGQDPPLDRDDRLRLAPGTTARSRPGSSSRGNTIDLHFIAPQFLAWFYPANGESSTRSGCWPSAATCSRRC